jgi:DNA-binding transcriptional ArsR family regulator
MPVRDVLPAARFDIAAFAELLAEPSRVAMVLSLMDGSARPATELAHIARVSAQTASSHFGRLARGGVLVVEPRGRHRYYRIASDDVAHAVEAMGLVRPPATPRSDDPARRPFRFARTCYRHLAGRVGVALASKLERDRVVVRRADRYVVALPARLQALLGDDAPPGGKPCLDWTERCDHIGGPLGVLLTSALLERRWLKRTDSGRALRMTAAGEEGFRSTFGLTFEGG